MLEISLFMIILVVIAVRLAMPPKKSINVTKESAALDKEDDTPKHIHTVLDPSGSTLYFNILGE